MSVNLSPWAGQTVGILIGQNPVGTGTGSNQLKIDNIVINP